MVEHLFFNGWGRKQLGLRCISSHPNLDVWERFCEFCPKTTNLSPLALNGARVTNWDGDESPSHWVKRSASAVYTSCSLLELCYNPTSMRFFSLHKVPLSSPTAYTRQTNANGQFSPVKVVPFWGKWFLEHTEVFEILSFAENIKQFLDT